jgi:MSHA biogenesis protein MshQ
MPRLSPTSLFQAGRHGARLAAALLAGALGLASGAAQAAVHTFGGADKVLDCNLSGKVYTCAKLSLPEWNDAVVIADGYTVNVKSDLAFGYNHGLSMSGSARLTSTGDLNIGGIDPNKFKVSGGSFEAKDTFTFGNQAQTMTADISAGNLVLGSGSTVKITGSMVSKGTVSIGSHATINGPVSGTTITTSSPVVINGAVSASTKFTLASGSKVTGKITAPVVDLLASGSVVTGDIKADSSLTLASGTTVDGDVDTGTLTLESSEAIVKGSAIVDLANLYWHGRVSDTITCRKGATAGDCSCVNNQSGYGFYTTLGPKCAAPAQPPGINHFRITHDGRADTCVPERVTVTACADASCSKRYTGGASVTLQPGGAKVTIGSSGENSTGEVSRIAKGVARLSLDHGGATGGATQCRNTTNGDSSCDMSFEGDANFAITVPDHYAGAGQTAIIQALKANQNQTACVPAFANVSKPVQYACNYVRPASGASSLSLGGTALACNGGQQAISTSFDANGKAQLALVFPDAGDMTLRATLEDVNGEGRFIAAPATFRIAASTAATEGLRSGKPFSLELTALNVNGVITRSFDSTKLGANPEATKAQLAVSCVPSGLEKGVLAPGAMSEFKDGVATVQATWSEAGKVDFLAAVPAFLGSTLKVEGASGANSPSCDANLGPFLPAWFEVALTDAEAAKNRKFYYVGEPVPVKVSAKSALGNVTRNYAGGLAKAATLSPWSDSGTVEKPGGGTLSGHLLAAASFKDGVATAAPVYTLGKTAPFKLRLRADNGLAAKTEQIGSLGAEANELARPLLRSGRLRIASRVGLKGTRLDLPVSAEYWTGKSWLLNEDDSVTSIPASAFSARSSAQLDASRQGAAPVIKPFSGTLKLSKGGAVLAVEQIGGGAGWVDLAPNLGGGASNNACVTELPASSGANLPWLRALQDCGAAGAPVVRDPAGRATFGIIPPENRRIIHVREVFH